MSRPYFDFKPGFFLCPCGKRSAPGMKAAEADFKYSTHHSHRIVLAQSLDLAVLHRASFAKLGRRFF
jgi:hypothetical protein